ncbi:hypothetical protein EGW08_013180, partial [Elysia chlorotica]
KGDHSDALLKGDYPDQLLKGDQSDALLKGDYSYPLLKGDHSDALLKGDYPDADSIKQLLRADGKGGWSFLRNSVTPAPIPGASLVTSSLSAGDFSCPSTFGIYRDPDNCRMFFQCVWFVAFHHVCGQGTAWNSYDRICDWPVRASC